MGRGHRQRSLFSQGSGQLVKAQVLHLGKGLGKVGLAQKAIQKGVSSWAGPISINPKRCSRPCASGLGKLESMRPKMASKEPFSAPFSKPKVVLVKAKVPDTSTTRGADKRYSLPTLMNISTSSVLDRVPPSKEFFGWVVVEKEASFLRGSTELGLRVLPKFP